jgi:hypothetical protein
MGIYRHFVGYRTKVYECKVSRGYIQLCGTSSVGQVPEICRACYQHSGELWQRSSRTQIDGFQGSIEPVGRNPNTLRFHPHTILFVSIYMRISLPA